MLLSIIIPTYNRSQFINDLLHSIISQDVSLEVIVVDDGSTDNTNELLQELNDNRIRYFKIKNSERGAARNYGLKQATGRYVNFFDSDDLFLPCLAELSEYLIIHQPDVLYGEILHERDGGQGINFGNLPYKNFTKNLLHNNFLACGSVFLKRQIALELMFHEDRRLSSAEDWELWLRVHARYPFTHYSSFVFKQIHHHERSLSTINPEKIEIRDEYFTQVVRQNPELRNFYGDQAINLFIADRFTFIALAWGGVDNQRAYIYWRKAIHSSIHVAKRKRFWAILKKIILSR